ncbi:MAG: biotin/lipoyl-binding protein [Eubacteriales bacterium]|nr:biotin/lipoyl-binding protein [Eubacteriales bacterium]MDD4475755.1 biotin/lipoyl-binding protein [Eubacteriales bacterium]
MKKYIVKVNGIPYEVEVEETAAFSSYPVAAAPVAPAATAPVAPASAAPEAPAAAPAAVDVPANGTKVEAPLPGSIVKLQVTNGQQVKAGDVLCILEAMKMENEILAPVAGKVSVIASQGTIVNSGDLLFAIE